MKPGDNEVHDQIPGGKSLGFPATGTLRLRVSQFSPRLIRFSIFSYIFSALISISAAQISLGLGLLGWIGAWLSLPTGQKREFLFTPIGWAYLLFLGTGILSVIFAENKLEALNTSRSFWLIFPFFLAANWIKTQKDLETCLKILFWVAALTSLIGFFQYLGEFRAGGYLLIPFKEKATGFFHGSMTFAGLLMIVSLVSIPLFFPRNIRPADLVMILPLGLIVCALLFTLERGAGLGFLGGIIILGVLRGKKVLICIIIGLLLVTGITFKLHPHIWSRWQSVLQFDENAVTSSQERILLWKTSWKIFQEHPLTGVGLNQFEKHAREIIFSKTRTPGMQVTLGHAHSNPFQLLATLGLLGFFAYLFLWYIVFREGFRTRAQNPAQSPFITGVLSALVGFHLEGFFEYNFGDSEIITLVWFLAGSMMALSRLAAEPAPEGEKT